MTIVRMFSASCAATMSEAAPVDDMIAEVEAAANAWLQDKLPSGATVQFQSQVYHLGARYYAVLTLVATTPET